MSVPTHVFRPAGRHELKAGITCEIDVDEVLINLLLKSEDIQPLLQKELLAL